jgi:peptidylprolyl isomerase
MRRVVVALMAAALLLSGCSSHTVVQPSVSPTAGDISLVTVGVSNTHAPKVTWPAGLSFSKSQSVVILQGKGEPLEDGGPLFLNEYVESLNTHEVLKNTFDRLPESTLLAPEFLGNDLYNILLTARVGTRILSIAPSLGEFAGEPAIVIVIDVLPNKATGEKLPVSPDLPQVTSQSTGEPDIALNPSKTLPVELSISTLIRGDGIQVKKGSYIVAKYKAVYTTDGSKDAKTWKAGDVQQSSWPPEQAPFEGQIGEGKVLKAWDEGLLDQTAGSRVMLIVPEAWGYPGEGTLVYVIDILAVYNEDS